MYYMVLIKYIGDELLKVDREMEEGLFQLKRDFADIVVEAYKWLKNRYPDAEIAAVWLNQVLKIATQAPFVVHDVRNHPQLFEQLQKSFHYTAPDFLRQLAKITGNQELIEQTEKYKEDFINFCRTMTISVNEKQQEVEFDRRDISKPCLILKFLSVTFFDVIEDFLEDTFKIYKHYLRIHKIKSGCIEVILQFDATMEQHFQECVKMKECKEKHCASMYIESKGEQPGTPKQRPDVKNKERTPDQPHSCALRQLQPSYTGTTNPRVWLHSYPTTRYSKIVSNMARTRGGGTAASVAAPRRSARLAGGNQDVHGRLSTHEDGASSRSPVPSFAHSWSPRCQGSPQSQHSTPPLSCLSKSPQRVSPCQPESNSLPRKPHMRHPPFLLPTPVPLSNPLTSTRAAVFSHASFFLSLLLSIILIH